MPAHQRRRVGGRDHHDRAGHALRSEVVLDEFAHLPAALADQGEDDDVAFGAERQHRQQGRFADAGAGEQAQALALAAGGEAVERPHAQVDARPEPGACGGLRRGGAGRAAGRSAEQDALAVERVAQRIDHPAEPGWGDIQHAHVPRRAGCAATVGQAVECAVGHCLQGGVVEADDFGQDGALIAGAQFQPVADRGEAGQSFDLDDEAEQVGDSAADTGRADALSRALQASTRSMRLSSY